MLNYVLEFLFNEPETVVTCAGGNLNQVFFAVQLLSGVTSVA